MVDAWGLVDGNERILFLIIVISIIVIIIFNFYLSLIFPPSLSCHAAEPRAWLERSSRRLPRPIAALGSGSARRWVDERLLLRRCLIINFFYFFFFPSVCVLCLSAYENHILSLPSVSFV